MPDGGSQPKSWLLCEDDAGRKDRYIVKWPDDLDGTKHDGARSKEFFNELFGLAMCESVGLPVAHGAIVRVRSPIGTVAAGDWFGTVFEDDFEAISPQGVVPDFSVVVGRIGEIAYRLMALDEFILNVDRKGGDLLVPKAGVSTMRPFLPIDHGNVLSGSHWTPDSLISARCAVPPYADSRRVFYGVSDAERANAAAVKILRHVDQAKAIVDELGELCSLTNQEARSLHLLLNCRAADLEHRVRNAVAQAEKHKADA
jgi:hypothetical protein